METYTSKTVNNNSRAAANSLVKQSGSSIAPRSTLPGISTLDDRRSLPTTISDSEQVKQMRLIQNFANNSSQVRQLRSLQAMANSFVVNRQKGNLLQQVRQFLYEQPPSRDKKDKDGEVIKKGDPILGGSCYAYSGLNAIIGRLADPPDQEAINAWINERVVRGAGGTPKRVLDGAAGQDDPISNELKKYKVQASPAIDAALAGALAGLGADSAAMLSVNKPSNHWISFNSATADTINAIDQQNTDRGPLAFTHRAAVPAGWQYNKVLITGARYKTKTSLPFTSLTSIDDTKLNALRSKPSVYKNAQIEMGGAWVDVVSTMDFAKKLKHDDGRVAGWWARGGATMYHLDGVFIAKKTE
ncbi:MAG TPA: hypothetical protein VKH37_12885 [Ferruginibacter sp.]|nr:hypothetical protein [Ferruginibacter sp.]